MLILPNPSYLVDGNAYFLSATEAARRIEFTLSKAPVIIVGIGYPNSNYVYDPRRGSDLTPPVKPGGHDHLFGMDGQVQHYPRPGGAKQFLEIIEDKIIPLVQKEFFPYLQLERSTKVLFGHSYGGLFTLYTLFTNTELFDMYVAASPSIWYDDCSIVYEYEGPFLKRRLRTKPCLFMGYGALEQNIHKLPHESEEDFLRRKQQAEELAMKDNAVNMFHRLQSSGKLGMMTLEEFYDEDHSGAATCGLHRGFKWLMNLRNQ